MVHMVAVVVDAAFLLSIKDFFICRSHRKYVDSLIDLKWHVAVSHRVHTYFSLYWLNDDCSETLTRIETLPINRNGFFS